MATFLYAKIGTVFGRCRNDSISDTFKNLVVLVVVFRRPCIEVCSFVVEVCLILLKNVDKL